MQPKKKKQNDSSPYGSYVTELQYCTGKKAERKIVKHECSDQNTIIIIRTLLLQPLTSACTWPPGGSSEKYCCCQRPQWRQWQWKETGRSSARSSTSFELAARLQIGQPVNQKQDFCISGMLGCTISKFGFFVVPLAKKKSTRSVQR